jgi:hypothetical protein
MTIRPVLNPPVLLDGIPFVERIARPILYPSAYPFSASRSPVAFGTLFGRNGSVSTMADAWPQGGIRTFPSAGFTLAVCSSSATDTLAGAGARSVEVDYLDTNYALKTLVFNLNGQTKVTAAVDVGAVLRVNDVRITAFGANAVNAGVIYVFDNSDTVTSGVPQTASKIFNTIAVGDNVCKGAFFTVPAGCRMLVTQARGGFDDAVVASRAAVINMYVGRKLNGIVAASVIPIVGQINSSGGPAMVKPDFPLLLDEKTDFAARLTANSAAPVAVFFDFILYHI